MRSRALLVVLVLHAAILLAVRPATPWEFDEPLFFQALHRYDPVAHHPPPPGYPVFIIVAGLLRQLIPSDFATLLVLSIAGSLAGFALLALAFRNVAGDMTTGIIGAALFYVSPALLVHSTLPISEPGALALLGAALYYGTRGDAPGRFAAFAALTVGWRPQFAIFVVPMFLMHVGLMRRPRDRGIALAVFFVVCLAWLAPLAIAVGGVEELIAFETGQGKYLASHDAAESRTGWTPVQLAFRFIAHPWGMKWLSFPVLLFALAGAVLLALRRTTAFLPMAIGGAVYLIFALTLMDPADGVRYTIPVVLVTAFCAAVAVNRLAIPPVILPALIACGAFVYTWPVLWQRRSTPSPPVQAALYARANLPSSAVVLYDLSLWPHATYYLADRRPMRVNEGLAAYFNRPDIPLYMYTDGRAGGRDEKVFAWAPSDAYNKLTRGHYGVVSLVPVPPEGRMRPIRGVYAIERAEGEQPWRWLAGNAEFQLPAGDARELTLRFGLPKSYPLPANEITVFVGERAAGTLALRPGQRDDVIVPVPAGSPIIRIEAARSHIPARVPGSLNYDRRRLSVMLLDVATSPARAAVLPPAASKSPALRTTPPPQRPARSPAAAP